ncbi:MAG TPA: hypothetical protein DDY88_07210 [Actinobacteria bacterium]|nr:hypothetical protein [Actinomycetota bacterium]
MILKTPDGKRRNRTAVVVSALSAAIALSLVGVQAQAAVPAANAAACAPQDGIDNSTIKLAFITDGSGANAASFAGTYEAAKLRLSQENAKGGVYGRKFVLTKYDGQSNAAVLADQTTKAIVNDKNFGVLDQINIETMFPILKAHNVPAIGIGLPPTGRDTNAFSAVGASSNDYTVNATAKRMAAAGAKNVATISFPVPAAVAAANGFNATLPTVGMTNVLKISDAPFAAYDATSTALRLKQAGADGVYLVLLVDGGISVMQALKQQGISMKAPLLPGLSDPDLIAKVGSALDGIIGSTYGTVPPGVPGRPGLRTFTNGMKAAGLNPNNPSSASAFVSADTFIEGMKLAGRCPTRQGFIDALHKAKSFSGAGLLPAPISYRPALTPNGNPAKCSWFVTVQNGKMVPDKAPVCGDYMDVNTGKIVAG